MQLILTGTKKPQDIIFGCCGALDLKLTGGNNYDRTWNIEEEGSLEVELGDIISAYDEFLNEDQVEVDFLLMGSSSLW